MAKVTIKLDKHLWQRIEHCAETAGYSSPQELIEHVLETQVARLEEDAEGNEEIVKRLKGLGYIDTE